MRTYFRALWHAVQSLLSMLFDVKYEIFDNFVIKVFILRRLHEEDFKVQDNKTKRQLKKST